jgi:hypothetical protein
VTTLRYPLSVKREYWPELAKDFFAERVAILAADGIPDAEALSETMTRRWWAMGSGEMFQGDR